MSYTLPCLERLQMSFGGRFRLLNCHFCRSGEVAMFVDVTSFKHSGVAMAIIRKAGILLV